MHVLRRTYRCHIFYVLLGMLPTDMTVIIRGGSFLLAELAIVS